MRLTSRLYSIAAVLWLGSALGGWAEAGIILQTPTGLHAGDSFRFVFVTDGIRDAIATNISDYDDFVNVQAGGATYEGAVVNWIAIGSTDSADAIDHVGQAAAAVYLPDGTPVTSNTTATGLWSGALAHAINLDLAGNPVDPLFFVWTGTNPTGTGFGGPLGSARPQTGSTTDTLGAWISSGSSPSGDLRHVYAISSILTVSQSSVAEPSILTLLGTALSVAFATATGLRSRRQRSAKSTREGGAPAGAAGPAEPVGAVPVASAASIPDSRGTVRNNRSVAMFFDARSSLTA